MGGGVGKKRKKIRTRQKDRKSSKKGKIFEQGRKKITHYMGNKNIRARRKFITPPITIITH